MFLAGCIFPEPPEYQAPKRTPPFLFAPEPTNTKVLLVFSDKRVNFNVNVRSEDNGEEIWAFLYLNYLIAGEYSESMPFDTLSPGTLDEVRQLSIRWTVPLRTPGTCEQLSLVASHRSNFDADHFPLPNRDDDLGVVTWWVVWGVDVDDSEATLANCPTSTGASQ